MKKKKGDLLQGTLEMLILNVLDHRSMHGYAIMNRIQQGSSGVLHIEEGSLYPALHRMQQKGWIEASWGASESNRCDKYYSLTEAGRRQREEEVSNWARLSEATSRVLNAAPEGT